MSHSLRETFGLTQDRLAAWLGVGRVAVAQSEGGQRGLPLNAGMQQVRLMMASLGKTFDLAPAAGVPPPPSPPPTPEPPPSVRRVDLQAQRCRLAVYRGQQQGQVLQVQAAQWRARLAATPLLRAYTGPVNNLAREAGWLALFEGEALDGLRDRCGPDAQVLLDARVAGLAREAEVLEAWLAAHTVATPAPAL